MTLDKDTIELARLKGSHTITVRKRDGSTEDVDVAVLPVTRYADFLAAVEDDVAVVKLCTGKDAAWLESIHADDALTVSEVASDLNFSGLTRWGARRRKATEALLEMIPGGAERLSATLSAASQGKQD